MGGGPGGRPLQDREPLCREAAPGAPPPSRGPPSADAGLPPALWGPAQPQPMRTQRLLSSIRDRRSSVLTGPPGCAREPPLEPLWRHLEACATSRPWATWSPWPVKQFFAYFIVIEKG